MELKDFINKPVIDTYSGKRYFIYEITSPAVRVVSDKLDDGHFTMYVYKTINGDPVSSGALVFEDGSLNEPFKKAFDAYGRTQDAFWEEYGYWMRKD